MKTGIAMEFWAAFYTILRVARGLETKFGRRLTAIIEVKNMLVRYALEWHL